MNWEEVLKIALTVIASLGGGGAIVFGLSGFLGRVWVDRLKGDIDGRLRRLEAALKHGTYVLQRLAEFELEAIEQCWQAAWSVVPRLNATRPVDSGIDEAVLTSRANELAEAHNKLLEAVGRHRPFLDDAVTELLNKMGQVARLELSQIAHHEHFKGDWWEKGAQNQVDLKALEDALHLLVQAKLMTLRQAAQDPAGY